MTVDWQALETEIIADINAAPAIAAKIKATVLGLKGSKLEPILEKVWPGIASAEDTFISELDFLSALDVKAIAWLNALFPKVAP